MRITAWNFALHMLRIVDTKFLFPVCSVCQSVVQARETHAIENTGICFGIS
jgi:imidazoleglycerol phosphate dehydratase HisB